MYHLSEIKVTQRKLCIHNVTLTVLTLFIVLAPTERPEIIVARIESSTAMFIRWKVSILEPRHNISL